MRAAIFTFISVCVIGCNPHTQNDHAAIQRYTPIADAAAAMVEEKSPFSISDPSVKAFVEKNPEIIGLILVVDRQNRISLIKDTSTSELIDERTDPITGSLKDPDGTERRFYEFRRKCRTKDSSGTLLVRIKRG